MSITTGKAISTFVDILYWRNWEHGNKTKSPDVVIATRYSRKRFWQKKCVIRRFFIC